MTSSALHNIASYPALKKVWEDHWKSAKRKTSSGVDGVTTKQFADNLNAHLLSLRQDLLRGYEFSRLRGVPIPKVDTTKMRLICIPTVKDRLVQRSLLKIIEQRSVPLGIANDVSYGFVRDTTNKKRGVTAARAAAIEFRRVRPWIFKADISAFFDNIPRDGLIAGFSKAFRLRSLHDLVARAIHCEVDDTDKGVRRVLKENGIRKGIGLRQGMPLSPILSNFLLRDFDASFYSHGYSLVRYADDLVAFASTEDECKHIEDFTLASLDRIGLAVNKAKTFRRSPLEPVEFLGMELRPSTDGNGYSLCISDQQMDKIREKFTIFHDLDYVIARRMNAERLFHHLEQMKIGYRAAYGIADNFSSFSQKLDQYATNSAFAVYSAIFGAEMVLSLPAEHKHFLMLPGT